jgi:hypothetical protein
VSEGGNGKYLWWRMCLELVLLLFLFTCSQLKNLFRRTTSVCRDCRDYKTQSTCEAASVGVCAWTGADCLAKSQLICTQLGSSACGAFSNAYITYPENCNRTGGYFYFSFFLFFFFFFFLIGKILKKKKLLLICIRGM